MVQFTILPVSYDIRFGGDDLEEDENLYGILAFHIMCLLLSMVAVISYVCRTEKHHAWQPQVIGVVLQLDFFVQCFDIEEHRFKQTDFERAHYIMFRNTIMLINTMTTSVSLPRKFKNTLILICLMFVGSVCNFEIYSVDIRKKQFVRI